MQGPKFLALPELGRGGLYNGPVLSSIGKKRHLLNQAIASGPTVDSKLGGHIWDVRDGRQLATFGVPSQFCRMTAASLFTSAMKSRLKCLVVSQSLPRCGRFGPL